MESSLALKTLIAYIDKGLSDPNNYTHAFVSKEENNIIIYLVKPTIVDDSNISEENDEEVELGDEVVRVMGVRIPAQDEINHVQQEVCIDDDNIPAPESVSTEATSLNIFDDVFSD